MIVYVDRLAADLAVLDVFLIGGGQIEHHRDPFPTVGALKMLFDQGHGFTSIVEVDELQRQAQVGMFQVSDNGL